MKVLYTGYVMHFNQNKDVKICLDYLNKHYTIIHNERFYIHQFDQKNFDKEDEIVDNNDKDTCILTKDDTLKLDRNEKIKFLTIRYYKVSKNKPKNGITTYVEFQRFDLQDFFHTEDTLIYSKTYIVMDLVKAYNEIVRDTMIDLLVILNNDVADLFLTVDNCESQVANYKYNDSLAIYKINIISITNDCDKIVYVLQNKDYVYKIESNYHKKLKKK